MNKKQRILTEWGLCAIVAMLCFILLSLSIPKAGTEFNNKNFLIEKRVEVFDFVAIGDSLTQGVGDSTNQGGFVPILADQLDATYGYRVESANYGVSGNTSSQIIKRIEEQKKIQNSIKNAEIITLTVGGNDVMKVIRENFDDLSENSFKKPLKAYQKRLVTLIELIRKYNKNAPIYVLGIYNPFYLNFPEITTMQDVIDNWNQETETTVTENKAYFVPINDVLYKGINGDEGVTSQGESDNNASITNDALFEEDHFHPNNTGYQIMANAIMSKIKQTKDEW
ncbi:MULTISPECIES: SGNH/GDSL hydrolase family protein [unclassified Enterococcus]|uniref:SGNH/GDSL hydrolase family protein n=1 Tax=unclassified Enterococcus TaxID=2608891 RepID=UPI001555595C|nr:MULTISPECIES: SGNH/GDSL hydrolase family protein [unclassified Enterococcus]MBS7577857.1 SGNH/GDSL hydrolase family protein [Enterococcus sp. MMGLQ5-2]MBS7585117.1 SGNH/GDSL hydrolase family protein [Enterococcus sp. MMGLQ5-1]NPD12973.1 SGNH/GDSL hydrolase family protein [Enterococcus sp. MMGLQ5-1]NPD37687.1 SGNH/GDSL hydrolase family protein [Enterococcus sp. MMGLQ5-2]